MRDHAWIADHIPHQGTMCLLDQVLDWNSTRVRCRSRAHRSLSNPLRSHGRLSAVCGIEFAAQAMAVHGALLASDRHIGRRAGYLVSVRGVDFHTMRLDDIEDDLEAVVERIEGNEVTVLYHFSLNAGTRALVTGRAAILIDPAQGATISPVSP